MNLPTAQKVSTKRAAAIKMPKSTGKARTFQITKLPIYPITKWLQSSALTCGSPTPSSWSLYWSW
jgi:hypothetical protein